MREVVTSRGRAKPCLVAVLALFLAPSFASATGYGDIEVTVKNEPRGGAFHGYAEIEFLIVNRGQAPHEVRLTYPKSSYGYGDYLRAVSRTVTVEGGKTARVSLAYPDRLHSGSGNAGVAIDGREQEESIRTGGGGGSYSRGYRGGGNAQPLILYSKSVDTRFPDWVDQSRAGGGFGMGWRDTELIRADQSADQWGTNWLGYTRYDGLVVTAEDLRVMPAEVRNAIGQYVECGGSLLVLGPNPSLPGSWKLKPHSQHPMSVATPGFGQCLAIERTDLSATPNLLEPAIESWKSTAMPWQRVRSQSEANRVFPVVDDVGVPVKGLLVLMFVFVIVIGPVNLLVLARKKRKLWLFWTVPAVSFVTCLVVIISMAVTEGWQGRSRVEGLTVLDENSRRASSLAWTGFYTPLLPRGGLHFSPETEVSYQNGEDRYSYRRSSAGSALTIDWTRDQHLASGWLTPRVPAHFVLRKSELRRERMTITKGADGTVEAVNGLGADLSEFWYLDEAETLYRADAIPAGGRATLKKVLVARAGGKNLRAVYAGDWSGLPSKLRTDAADLLAPRTYFGVLEGAPFLDEGMPNASVRKARSTVYGILKEGGDGG